MNFKFIKQILHVSYNHDTFWNINFNVLLNEVFNIFNKDYGSYGLVVAIAPIL